MKQLLTICLLLTTQFAAAQVPAVTAVSPAQGVPGSSVTITGTNFNTTADSNIVFFGATRAVVTSAASTSLTAAIPNGATYSNISVIN